MPTKNRKSRNEKIPLEERVIFGGISGMVATTIVHPIDLIKVRMQLYPQEAGGSFNYARRIIRCGGYRALYTGLSAALMRQATYTTTRLGVYGWLYDGYKKKHGKKPRLSENVMFGITAGLAGAFVGTPSEVALVRLMAGRPKTECATSLCPVYSGVFDAFRKIIRDEGVRGLWRGGFPTMGRAIFVSAAQITTYAHTRDFLLENKMAKGLQLHIFTALISTFVTAIISLPVDNVKTKYQVSKKCECQSDILGNMIKREGIIYLWQGLLPYYVRMAFHTMITFVIIEELNGTYQK